MLGVLRNQCLSWGDEVVRLRLPGAVLEFKGLSETQREAIARLYPSFVDESFPATPDAVVFCIARRASESEIAEPGYCLVNGRYELRKQRFNGRVRVSGYRFVATLECEAVHGATAILGVGAEEDLGSPIVLENFLRTVLGYQVPSARGVLLHSAGIVQQGRAYLFSGYSGAGKTTLSRKAAAVGAPVLSDDINLVMPENGEYRAHKVPFTGEFGRSVENMSGNGSFPLGGLVLLEKKPVLSATRVSKAMAVAGLLANCPFVNDDPEEFPTLTDILTDLVGAVPVIRLGVARDDAFEAIMNTVQESLAYA